ncbi:TetR/AcrR family transcriptional regulator [Mycobacterium sp. SMC-4]|uniref:TetR/AcrR family transcriptional regulator n=1 Tax=Mycobacterium sp. SMC-4 TaxID=2857059 RepID=UPI003D00D35D
MNHASSDAARRRVAPGRPTREQALQRAEDLLDGALEVFLDRGYDYATIDAIAAQVGMAKRTIYARYRDKEALFRAAVQRAIDRWVVPVDDLQNLDTGDLEETLIAVARARLQTAVSSDGVRLQRILNAEAYRFPELGRQAYEQGTLPVVRFIAEVLRRHASDGGIAVDEPELLGTSFLSLVIGGPAHGVLWGAVLDNDAVADRIRTCVRLFLDGARPR